MDKIYEGVWAETAQTDLIRSLYYMAEDSPGNALNIFRKNYPYENGNIESWLSLTWASAPWKSRS